MSDILGDSQDIIFRYTEIERNILFIFTIEMANICEYSFIFLIDIEMFAIKGDNKEIITPTMNIIIDSWDYDLVTFTPSEFLVFHEEGAIFIKMAIGLCTAVTKV